MSDAHAEPTRLALSAAQEEADRFRHHQVSSAHLLVGVLRVASADPVVAEGFEPEMLPRARELLSEMRSPKGEEGFSAAASAAVGHASDIARQLGDTQVHPRHLLLAVLTLREESAAHWMLHRLGVDQGELVRAVTDGVNRFDEEKREAVATGGRRSRGRQRKPKSMLSQVATDLTSAAGEGKLDPLIGRDDELDALLVVLGRRGKQNPVLTGPAGVGKTAIVEGLAQRMAEGQVPPTLAGRRLWSVDVGLLLAGTRNRGDMEERAKQLLEEAETTKAVLFVDEIHQLLGSSRRSGETQGGGMGMADLLKPALGRGAVTLVGATTDDEYRQMVNADAAFDRRFREVSVDEPTSRVAETMVRRLADRYAGFHGVVFDDEAFSEAVRMTVRHLPDRRLPDKAVDALDEASAAVRMAETYTPTFSDYIEAKVPEPVDDGPVEPGLASAPRPPSRVGAQAVAEAVAGMAGLPVEQVAAQSPHRLRHLEEELALRVSGQQQATSAVARPVRRSRVGFDDPSRPQGAVLLAGPPGVGKSLTAQAVADVAFDGALVTVDLSQVAGPHDIARLVGAPPGYVGYSEEPALVRQVRTNPASVVLFDEVDKAHPEALRVLLQVLEEGRLTDGQGRRVDFSQTLVVATVTDNAAVVKPATGFAPTVQGVDEAAAVSRVKALLSPELFNRMDEVVICHPLDEDALAGVVDREVAALADRLAEQEVSLELADSARRRIAALAVGQDAGARPVRGLVTSLVSGPIEDLLYDGEVPAGGRVLVAADGDGEVRVQVARETAEVT